MVGSTVEEAVDDDEVSQRAQVKYEVVGTLSDKTADKPSCVAETVEVHNISKVSVQNSDRFKAAQPYFCSVHILRDIY